ncbi:peptidylprolyl isomerase [candidate division KSB1 bacterium]|nr:peptidylprolyl isomerase [candidate division KSB1 bacterium]
MILWLNLYLFNCGSKETVIAKFGPHQITLEEFRVAYLEVLKQPNTFDSREAREQFLNELIRRRLLAEAAQNRGLALDERLQGRLDAYRNKCLREAHYDRVIRPQIQMNAAEIAEVYTYTQEKRHLQQLFTPRKSQADSLYQMLQQGFTFNQLAAWLFQDTTLARTGGDLGWIEWEQFEYNLAMTAFRQPVHTYSVPVASQFGYHILYIKDFQKKPILTEYEFARQKNNTQKQLEFKLGEEIARAYLQKMMSEKKIQVYPRALEWVGQKLQPHFRRKPTQFDQMFATQLNEIEQQALETTLWEQRHEVMATIDGTAMTIGDFIHALSYIPYAASYQSYKTALDYALRDMALTAEAKKLHLDRDPAVLRKVRLYQEYWLQLKLRRQINRGVTVSEAELQAEYQRNVNYQKVTYEAARDLISPNLLQAKKLTAVSNFEKQLLQNLKLQLNPAAIHAYYDQLYRLENRP